MLYRIDLKHFLTHMVDFFTSNELLHFHYIVLSSEIIVKGTILNVSKVSELYPEYDMVDMYNNTKDKDRFRDQYLQKLLPNEIDKKLMKKGKPFWMDRLIYFNIINPLIKHHDIILLCMEFENDYMDILCEVLENKYKLEVTDLNKLFSEGRAGIYELDLDVIKENIKEERKLIIKEHSIRMIDNDEKRKEYIKNLSTKTKIKMIKNSSLSGIKIMKEDLDDMVNEVWNEIVNKL